MEVVEILKNAIDQNASDIFFVAVLLKKYFQILIKLVLI